MALDFPDTPAVGDVYGTWKWDGLRWVAITVTGVRGAVAYSQSFTTQNIATTTPTDLSDMSVSWIASPTRTYRTSVFFLASSTVVNDDLNADITDAANTRKQLFPNPYLDPNTSITMSASLVETGLTGTIYRKVRAWRSGTGTMSIAGDATYPRYILVEDITYEAGPTGGSGGGGGSGFTFVQDTKPTAERQGDTWFNTATDAGGGRSAVAVYEAPGGELVWVQFAPGSGASNAGAWAIATQTAGQAIVATGITTISWSVPTLGDIVYEPPAIGTLAFVLPRTATYIVYFALQANIGTIDRVRITLMGQNSMDSASIGGTGTITLMRVFNAGDKLQFQTYNGGAAGTVTLARVEIREIGPSNAGMRL